MDNGIIKSEFCVPLDVLRLNDEAKFDYIYFDSFAHIDSCVMESIDSGRHITKAFMFDFGEINREVSSEQSLVRARRTGIKCYTEKGTRPMGAFKVYGYKHDGRRFSYDWRENDVQIAESIQAKKEKW